MNDKGKSYEWIGARRPKTVLWFLVAAVIVVAGAVYKYSSAPVAQPRVLHNDLAKDTGDDVSPVIAFGNGQWVAAWSSNENLKGGNPAESNILFASSSDGKSWSKPQLLVSDPALSKGNDMAPTIATDGKGTWAVAWSSTVAEIKAFNTTLQIKDDVDLLIADSSDNGKTWANLHPLNRNADSDSPDYYSGDADKTKAEPDGDVQLTTNGSYWFVTWTGRSRVINVAGAGCGDYMKPNRIYTQYTTTLSSGSGSTWYGPYCISAGEADMGSRAAADSKGNWVILWSSTGNVQNTTLGKDSDILAAHAKESLWSVPDPAVKWSFPLNVAEHAASDGPADSDQEPAVATDGKGLWLAVWSSRASNVKIGGTATSLGADGDLLFASSTDNGMTWKSLGALNTNADSDSGHDTAPHIATNGSGKWIAVWQSTENLGGSIGTDTDILIAKSSDNGSTWSAPKPLANNADKDTGADTMPQVATDGSEWVVVWQSDEDGGSGKDSDILFAELKF